jgi:hypothetical protein
MATYAAIVSTCAAVASLCALYLHWKRWRHDQRTRSLIVRLEVGSESEAIDRWRPSTITLRSRANTGYTANSVRVLWPPSGEIAVHYDLFAEKLDAPWEEPVYRAPDLRLRHMEIDLTVAHAGQGSRIHPQGGFRIAYGDKESQRVFLRRRGHGRMLVAIAITPEDDSERSFNRYKFARV